MFRGKASPTLLPGVSKSRTYTRQNRVILEERKWGKEISYLQIKSKNAAFEAVKQFVNSAAFWWLKTTEHIHKYINNKHINLKLPPLSNIEYPHGKSPTFFLVRNYNGKNILGGNKLHPLTLSAENPQLRCHAHGKVSHTKPTLFIPLSHPRFLSVSTPETTCMSTHVPALWKEGSTGEIVTARKQTFPSVPIPPHKSSGTLWPRCCSSWLSPGWFLLSGAFYIVPWEFYGSPSLIQAKKKVIEMNPFVFHRVTEAQKGPAGREHSGSPGPTSCPSRVIPEPIAILQPDSSGLSFCCWTHTPVFALDEIYRQPHSF